MRYSRVVGVKELVLGAPCVPGGGGMVGGVNLGCAFTSAGESGMVERFSVRSVGRHKQARALVDMTDEPPMRRDGEDDGYARSENESGAVLVRLP